LLLIMIPITYGVKGMTPLDKHHISQKNRVLWSFF
jgi:hypothetical protein